MSFMFLSYLLFLFTVKIIPMGREAMWMSFIFRRNILVRITAKLTVDLTSDFTLRWCWQLWTIRWQIMLTPNAQNLLNGVYQIILPVEPTCRLKGYKRTRKSIKSRRFRKKNLLSVNRFCRAEIEKIKWKKEGKKETITKEIIREGLRQMNKHENDCND